MALQEDLPVQTWHRAETHSGNAPRMGPRPSSALAGSILALVIASVTLPVAAEPTTPIYRWHDEAGRTHFGDRAPDGASNTERIEVRDHRRDYDLQDRHERMERMVEAYGEERAERSEARDAVRRADALRERNCSAARKRDFEFRHAQRLYREDRGGERQILDDAARDDALAAAAQAVQRWCGEANQGS